jgi:hypothetical protein
MITGYGEDANCIGASNSKRITLMTKKFVQFDEIEDVLSSLDLLALVLPLVRTQPSYWKWTIVAAHAGLQGAMVCALRDTSGVSILEKQCAREMLNWFDTRHGERPEEKLADFATLLTRCRKASWMEGQPLKICNAQINDIRRLHRDFRNNFAHFIPKGWSIEKAGVPRIIKAAVDATEILMGHSRVIYKLSGNRKRRLAHRLKTIRVGLM